MEKEEIMEAVDFKMPIVVNQQIVTVANSNGSLVSDNNFVSFQELISGNRRLWRLQQNSAQFYFHFIFFSEALQASLHKQC